MTHEQEFQIIDLVVTIFQNVGIKRCIDKIDILKNYQIYFQICKVIFPQTMIQLLRFSEGPQTNAQKIQGVISIVGKILQNDLYHISGEAIAEGKLSHIRNFLHILELLSENVHKGNHNEGEVESAPEDTRSNASDFDQDGHYTVIGIDNQFQREFDDEDGHNPNINIQEEPQTKRDYHQKNSKRNDEHTDNEDSQSERPMNPVLDKKQQSSKKKFVKSTKPRGEKKVKFLTNNIQIHEVKPKPYKPSEHSFKKKPAENNQIFEEYIRQRQPKESIRKKAKSAYVKKINNIIEDFEAKKLTDMKLEYNIWVKRHELKCNQKENQIEAENRQRMDFTDQLIVERRQKINTLRNAKQAVNIMANLFKEQRNILKGMKKAKQETELEEIQALIEGDDRDQRMLREALIGRNPEKLPM